MVPVMDFAELKEKTHELWIDLHELNDCYVPDHAAFESEVAQYGSLTEETTWRKAYASLRAKFLAAGCLEDDQYLIEFYLLYAAKRWGWEDLLPQVIEQLCQIPAAYEAIASGLAKIRQNGCEYGANPTEVEQLGVLTDVAAQKQRQFRRGAIPTDPGNSDRTAAELHGCSSQ
jgi:hypothetical protein